MKRVIQLTTAFGTIYEISLLRFTLSTIISFILALVVNLSIINSESGIYYWKGIGGIPGLAISILIAVIWFTSLFNNYTKIEKDDKAEE